MPASFDVSRFLVHAPSNKVRSQQALQQSVIEGDRKIPLCFSVCPSALMMLPVLTGFASYKSM